MTDQNIKKVFVFFKSEMILRFRTIKTLILYFINVFKKYTHQSLMVRVSIQHQLVVEDFAQRYIG